MSVKKHEAAIEILLGIKYWNGRITTLKRNEKTYTDMWLPDLMVKAQKEAAITKRCIQHYQWRYQKLIKSL